MLPHSIFLNSETKIVFCNNPFKADLMIDVLERLRRSLAETSDEGILIYLTPIPPQIKKRLDIYEIIGQGRYLSHFGGFQSYYIYQVIELQIRSRSLQATNCRRSARATRRHLTSACASSSLPSWRQHRSKRVRPETVTDQNVTNGCSSFRVSATPLVLS
jgi:hypothetical protein